LIWIILNNHIHTYVFDPICLEAAMRKLRTWFLVADGSRARLVFESGNDATGSELVYRAERRRMREAISGPPGRSFASVGRRRSAMQAHSDPVREDEREFAAMLAKVLDDQLKAGGYDHVVIAAAPRMLGEIRRVLSGDVVERVLAELPKDLTKQTIAGLRAMATEIREGAR
jgi:protein required for attachment to host cells